MNAIVETNEPRQPTRESNGTVSARRFSVAIAIYFMGCVAGFMFVSRVFGIEHAIGLSLIATCPIVVAIRMRSRWHSAVKQEFIFLVLLFIVAMGSSLGLVRSWYDADIDLKPEDRIFAEFRRALRQDPSFQGITVSPKKVKGTYIVTGAVASEADLQRLVTIAHRFGITGLRPPDEEPYRCGVRIEVRANN